MNLKKDNEGTKAVLDKTKGARKQTEFVLTNIRQSLAEETMLRKAQANGRTAKHRQNSASDHH